MYNGDSKTEDIVFCCPFCSLVWFSSVDELARHLYSHHLRDSLKMLASLNKRKAIKSNGKWSVLN